MSYMTRHRCCVCRKLTYHYQKINGGRWHCYDGCYSTTGRDRRTEDGSPAWIKQPDDIVNIGVKPEDSA